MTRVSGAGATQSSLEGVTSHHLMARDKMTVIEYPGASRVTRRKNNKLSIGISIRLKRLRAKARNSHRYLTLHSDTMHVTFTKAAELRVLG